MNEEAIKETEKQIEDMEKRLESRIEYTHSVLLRQIRAEARKTMSVRGIESMLDKHNFLFGTSGMGLDEEAAVVPALARCARLLSSQMTHVADMLEDEDITDADAVAELLDSLVDYDFCREGHEFTNFDVAYFCLWMDFMAGIADTTDRLQQFVKEVTDQIDECKAKLTELTEEE